MSKEDPPVVFVGAWYSPSKQEKRFPKFSLFSVWNSEEKPYWGFDNIGVFKIELEKLSESEIGFKKKYVESQAGVPLDELQYTGRSLDGKLYEGEWIGTDYSGHFILTTTKEGLPEVDKIIGSLQRKSFEYQIKEKREELSYLPLWLALKK